MTDWRLGGIERQIKSQGRKRGYSAVHRSQNKIFQWFGRKE